MHSTALLTAVGFEAVQDEKGGEYLRWNPADSELTAATASLKNALEKLVACRDLHAQPSSFVPSPTSASSSAIAGSSSLPLALPGSASSSLSSESLSNPRAEEYKSDEWEIEILFHNQIPCVLVCFCRCGHEPVEEDTAFEDVKYSRKPDRHVVRITTVSGVLLFRSLAFRCASVVSEFLPLRSALHVLCPLQGMFLHLNSLPSLS